MAKQLVLIAGSSAGGKSASLENLRDQENIIYLNCEAGKLLPFKNKFKRAVVTDPMQVPQTFVDVTTKPELANIHTIIVDSLTFMMEMYESQYVLPSTNTQAAWGDFQQFFKELMQVHVAKCRCNVIFIAHTYAELNEATGLFSSFVPVKGALKKNGIEAYFTTVVHAKRMPLIKLKDYSSDLLNINKEEKIVGFKYVYQTRVTKETVEDRIRGPKGLFSVQQTFMDNDAQLLLDHLDNFYA